MLNWNRFVICLALFCGFAEGQTLNCNLQGYKSADGLKADLRGGAVELVWRGESGQELRASFAVRDGQPEVRELAARKNAGRWVIFRGILWRRSFT